MIQYAQARDLIQDGDCIGVTTVHSFIGRLTQYFTGKYTHVGLAIWFDGGLWMAEINGGRNHLVPLSQYEKSGFDVYSPPEGLDIATIRHEIVTQTSVMQDYGYLQNIATGLIEYFKLKVHWKMRDQKHCAGYVIYIYDLAGWRHLAGYEHLLLQSPTKLCGQLNLKLSVEKTE